MKTTLAIDRMAGIINRPWGPYFYRRYEFVPQEVSVMGAGKSKCKPQIGAEWVSLLPGGGRSTSAGSGHPGGDAVNGRGRRRRRRVAAFAHRCQ